MTEAQIVHREAGEPSGVNKEVTIDAMEIPNPIIEVKPDISKDTNEVNTQRQLVKNCTNSNK